MMVEDHFKKSLEIMAAGDRRPALKVIQATSSHASSRTPAPVPLSLDPGATFQDGTIPCKRPIVCLLPESLPSTTTADSTTEKRCFQVPPNNSELLPVPDVLLMPPPAKIAKAPRSRLKQRKAQSKFTRGDRYIRPR